MDEDSRTAMKRYAFQLMPQLPEDRAEAHAVVEYLHHLIEWRHSSNGDVAPFHDNDKP